MVSDTVEMAAPRRPVEWRISAVAWAMRQRSVSHPRSSNGRSDLVKAERRRMLAGESLTLVPVPRGSPSCVARVAFV
jgi:hypothetical protein